MASKKSSAWKQRLASMTPAQAEAYKKADNERVAVYRAKRKAERKALKEGGQPPSSPSVSSSAPAPKQGSEATTSATAPEPSRTAPEPSRSLFTRYIGISEQSLARGVRPVAEAFHRSDFFEMGLRPTDDVRDIPVTPFSSGERLHERARLYQATNEQRLVFLGVDDRAEEAAGRFVATQTRYAEALRKAVAPGGDQKSTSKNAKRRQHATATADADDNADDSRAA